jgi:flotillin
MLAQLDGLKLSFGQIALISAVAFVILFFVVASMLRSLIWICRPNEILIFSGRKHRLPDGSEVGFRVKTSGLTLRVPVVEQVDRMDMTVMPIELSISNAYSKDNIPLNVQAIANVKISSNPRVVMNAIERFLGRHRGEIMQVAKETLEGSVRGVLATLTPEQVNEDRLKFAESLSNEVEDDFEKLGLHLDTLKIQHVHDDAKYLDSIGRQQIALVLRDAENAESDARREASQLQSAAAARAREAKENAQQSIAKRKNDLRRYKAELKAAVQAEEERAQGAGRQARAIAEQELQGVRRSLEERRLEAEVVIPAEAKREAENLLARGRAAPIFENGAALAQAIGALSEAWRDAGSSAKEIFLVQQIDRITQKLAEGIKDLKIGHVNLIDRGDGSALAGYVRSFPATMNALLDELKTTTGLDIRQTLGGSKGEV